jgi:hypothetical protein
MSENYSRGTAILVVELDMRPFAKVYNCTRFTALNFFVTHKFTVLQKSEESL